MADRPEISLHELAVYRVLKSAESWLSNSDITAAVRARGIKVSARTVRLHTARMVEAGVIERAPVFPGHRFKVASKVPKVARNYVARLQEADEVFE